MAMATFYLDHNVAVGLVELLHGAGCDVTTAREMGRERAGDEDHLLFAAQMGWTIVTHNASHFLLLHNAWLGWSKAWHVSVPHAGILIVPHLPPARTRAMILELLASDLTLVNRLYQWRASTGWARL